MSVGQGISIAATTAQGAALGSTFGPVGTAVGALAGLAAGFFGDGDDEPEADNLAREAFFRQQTGHAAPTGNVRDVEIPTRRRAFRDALGDAGQARLVALFQSLGFVPGLKANGQRKKINHDTVGGIDAIHVAGLPFANGWPEFSIGIPSPWRQLVDRTPGLTDQILFDALRTGSVPAAAGAPTAAFTEDAMPVGEAITGIIGALGGAQGIANIIGAFTGETGAPGAGPVWTPGMGLIPGLTLPLPGPDLNITTQPCPTFVRPSATTVGMAKEVQVTGPRGKVHTYRNKGRALLYADDLAAVRRVRRAASQANRVCGARRVRRGRR